MTTEDNNEAIEESVEEVVKKTRKKKSKYDFVQDDGREAYMSVYTISILVGAEVNEYKVAAEEERIAKRLTGWNGADPLTIIEVSVYSP